MKLLRSDQIKELSKKADDAIQLKGIFEAVDGVIIQGTLVISVNALERWKNTEGEAMVPDEVCEATQGAVDLLLSGSYGEALSALEPIADKYINFKKVDDDTEAALFGVVFFLLKTIIGYFTK